jgi:hypothetical protein
MKRKSPRNLLLFINLIQINYATIALVAGKNSLSHTERMADQNISRFCKRLKYFL